MSITMEMMECGHNVRYEIREEIPDPEHHPIGDVAVARYCAICAIDNYRQAEKHIAELEARFTNAEEWGRRVSDYAGGLAVSHNLVMRSDVGEIEGVLIALHERLEQVERERATARAQVQRLREACEMVLDAGKQLSNYRWAEVFTVVRDALRDTEAQP